MNHWFPASSISSVAPVGSTFPALRYYTRQLAGVTGRILEPATGTGRVLVPLLEAGFAVEGLDVSPDKPSERPVPGGLCTDSRQDGQPGQDEQPPERRSHGSLSQQANPGNRVPLEPWTLSD